MLTRKSLLLAAAMVASGTLFAATELKANPMGVPVAQPVPLSCTTSNFRVAAVLGPNGEFPKLTQCTGLNSGQTCSDYGYRISSLSSKGPSIDHTVFANSADQDLDGTNPTSFVSKPGDGDNTTGFLLNADHEYAVRFNSSNTKSVEAHMFIVGSSSPRISSVLVRSGTKIIESCLIAGPGVVGDPFQPVYQEQLVTVAGGKCVAHLIFDASGKVIDVTTDPPCVVGAATDGLFVGDEEIRNNTGPHGITFGDNTTTCYGPPIPSPAKCVCTKAPCP